MTARELALRYLLAYEESGAYPNLSLNSPAVASLDKSERGFLTALLYTAVERKLTLDYEISALSKRPVTAFDAPTLALLRMTLAEIRYFDKIPSYAAVSETLRLSHDPAQKAILSGVLHAAERTAPPRPPREKNEARYLSVAYSFPLPLVKFFIGLYGTQTTEKILSVYNEKAPLTLTVNPLKTTRDAYIARLSRAGIEAVPSALSPLSAVLSKEVRVPELPGFSEGCFHVQDAASAFTALALDAKPGERVVDVCAAPGGKSFTVAESMGGRGEVFSFDLHEGKLPMIADGAARLGLSSVLPRAVDATVGEQTLFGTADRVLCDVPCSGLGVLGKKPDLRYADLSRLETLPPLAYAVLEKSADYLKVGGTLVYSTCTLNPGENEANVERFLAAHSEFTALPFALPNGATVPYHTFRPDTDGCDGFFVARMRKIHD